MALFKIEKGLAASLATARPTTHEGWCYFTTNEGKFYIDIADGDDLSARVCLNAAKADKLTVNAGDANTPVYFKDGVPVACTSLGLNTTGSSASCTGNAASANKLTISAGNSTTPVYFKDGRPVACDNLNLSGDYLPLTAGADYKLTGALGLT